ncbi:MAG: hypothetical protein Tp182DCM212571_31 [Prokaryotic dsDNA virus sp.]|jgi:hypothetical protein|nr:MAG: hypothetical protein Tp182DCM212571_31 [Prokaryotic dsDNA virus sp.]
MHTVDVTPELIASMTQRLSSRDTHSEGDISLTLTAESWSKFTSYVFGE